MNVIEKFIVAIVALPLNNPVISTDCLKFWLNNTQYNYETTPNQKHIRKITEVVLAINTFFTKPSCQLHCMIDWSTCI